MVFCPMCGCRLIRRELDGFMRIQCPEATCGYVCWNNPTPVVAAIVEQHGKIVLARNSLWPEGRFALIAGFLEEGESPDEAVLREIGEELGVSGRIRELVGNYGFAERNQVLMVYHVEIEGEIRLNEELAEFKIVEPNELVPWPIGTGPAVRDWMIRHGYGAATA